MAGTNNFQVFDSNNTNMMSDTNYTTSTAHINGVSNGLADPTLDNKAQHQASIMAAAIAKFIASQNQNAMDTDVEALKTAFTAALSAFIAGTGAVTGPSVATDGQIALFSGTTGRVIKAGPKITFGTAAPSGGSNGDIYIMYS